LQDLDTDRHHLQSVRKLFVAVDSPAFSDIHMYVIPCKMDKSQCKNTGVLLSEKVFPVTTQKSRNMKNEHLKLEFAADGTLSKINNFGESLSTDINERYTAYRMGGGTRYSPVC